MKKIIILLALFIIILSMASCFLDDQIDYSKVQLDQALSNIINKYNHNKLKDLQKEKVEKEEEEEEQTTFEVIEGKKEQCMCISWFLCSCSKTKSYITWMKIKAKEIVDQDKKVIAALKDKLRYSYSVSPIKYNNDYSKYVMPLILFESMDKNIEVTSFNLTDHKKLDFNNKGVLGGWIQGIPKVEKSSEEGYQNVYPYGILNAISPTGGEELISAFKSLYKNGKWDFMKAEIKVKDKTKNQESTYNILLDGKLFNEFIKTVINNHQGTTTANTKFQVPINN
ncbi:P23-like cell envelope protein [Borrelia duttonii CR2A]|uniref:p23-like cell envelope protein n=1 Tax=Borrelia duttonii CR2A TaxID=1432657 RepID=W6TGB9_9SPIR|nr:S2/P23 family protein [Borrelia duttonii]ETZ17962.1 P23-like cell envelope protein [Borrelia duttonii CR2A]